MDSFKTTGNELFLHNKHTLFLYTPARIYRQPNINTPPHKITFLHMQVLMSPTDALFCASCQLDQPLYHTHTHTHTHTHANIPVWHTHAGWEKKLWAQSKVKHKLQSLCAIYMQSAITCKFKCVSAALLVHISKCSIDRNIPLLIISINTQTLNTLRDSVPAVPLSACRKTT